MLSPIEIGGSAGDALVPFDGRVRFVDLAAQPQWLGLLARWQQRQWPSDSFEQRLAKLEDHLLAKPLPTSILALRDEILLGSVSIVRYQRLGGLAPSYWLANLFVVEQSRRQGLGAALVANAQQLAKAHGVSDLYLYATDQVAFYQALGWRSLQSKMVKGEPVTIMYYKLS